MYATYGVNVRRTITICALLPAFFAFSSCNKNSGKRSLHNYVATSVPYTVQSHGLRHDGLSLPSSLSEKADLSLATHDNAAQDMLDCVNENHCINNVTISEHSAIEGTFKPFSQDELDKFLQKFGTDRDHPEAQETTNKIANYYSVANSNNIETSSAVSDSDKSKAWNLISYQQHHQPLHPQHHNTYSGNNNNNNNKNPYDDRMGWVTLEPIAWSSSQVQKWEPNTKPSWPLPSASGPWSSPSQYQQQSNYGGYSDRPYKKPTYQYQSKPWNSKPQFSNYFGTNNQEIITDGQSGHFPNDRPSPSNQGTGSYKPWLEHTQTLSYIDSANRPATHIVYQGIGTGTPPHPHIPERPLSQSSSDGDGHWVLLSSTKGYSVPNRQRSFGRSLKTDEDAAVPVQSKIEKRARPISARRSINLTVLPKKGLTVTSHDGMIEREATHQTVDESHREHLARMMQFGNVTTQKEPPSIAILSR